MKIIFILVGILIAIGGIFIIVSRQIKKSHCIELTKGKIIDIVRQKNREIATAGTREIDRNVTTSFYPVYEYTVNGNTYVKRSSSGSSTPTFFIGQEVDIHYNPENANEYYANQNIAPIITGTGLTIVGVIIMVIGFILEV